MDIIAADYFFNRARLCFHISKMLTEAQFKLLEHEFIVKGDLKRIRFWLKSNFDTFVDSDLIDKLSKTLTDGRMTDKEHWDNTTSELMRTQTMDTEMESSLRNNVKCYVLQVAHCIVTVQAYANQGTLSDLCFNLLIADPATNEC